MTCSLIAGVCHVRVATYDRSEVTLPVKAPGEPGCHEFSAKIIGAVAKPVLSRRLVTVNSRVEDT
jgi:hypothetical protein